MIHTWIGNDHYFICKKPGFYVAITVCIKKSCQVDFCVAFFRQYESKAKQHSTMIP